MWAHCIGTDGLGQVCAGCFPLVTPRLTSSSEGSHTHHRRVEFDDVRPADTWRGRRLLGCPCVPSTLHQRSQEPLHSVAATCCRGGWPVCLQFLGMTIGAHSAWSLCVCWGWGVGGGLLRVFVPGQRIAVSECQAQVSGLRHHDRSFGILQTLHVDLLKPPTCALHLPLFLKSSAQCGSGGDQCHEPVQCHSP